MGQFSHYFGEIYPRIRHDIFEFCKLLNFTPNVHQQRYFRAVMLAQAGKAPVEIAVKSGQGTGKTSGSVVVALYRLIQAENSRVVLTAPTMRQCNDIWLAEARLIIGKADEWFRKRVEISATDIQMFGNRNWSVETVTATDPKKAQGFHRPNMTIICEEASGITRQIIEQFEGTATNPNCMFIQQGNPNIRDCAFYDCFYGKLKHQWQRMTFNSEHTPASEWFSPLHTRKIAEKYGIDSDVYRIRVKGEFPSQDPNCVLSSDDIEKITDRKYLDPMRRVLGPEGRLLRQFGIDLARFGGDESVIYQRQGNALVDCKWMVKKEPSEAIDYAIRMQKDLGWRDDQCWYVVDATGIGQGVMSRLYERNKNVHEFHNGGKSISTDYDNKITEAWFGFARRVKAHTDRSPTAFMPYDSQAIQQLSGRQYYTTRMGKLVLESKDEYMDRGHESPDRADAAVMAMYDEVYASGRVSGDQK